MGELIPRPKTKKAMNEPMRARAMHMLVINTWMNPNTELEFCTALVSQLCQVLSGYNCVNVGLKLLESEQMDCRGAGVIQATLCARVFAIASMAPTASMVASMAPMASMVASMDSVASMASMVVALMAPMVSVAWVDLMAPELKSERESALVWRALVAPHSPYQALCFAFAQMPFWYSAINELASRCHTEGEGQIQKSQTGGKIGVRADGCCKIGEERDEGLSHKIVGKNDVEKIEVELVRNELMGSTEKGRFESRNTAFWCGSRAAGWRVAAGKTTVLIGVLSLLTSEASFVPVAWIWNAMVPRLEMATALSENWIPK